MNELKMRINQNGLDAEIDEFGDLNSLRIENSKIKFGFKKRMNPKAVERSMFDKTGISQLGTTYPSCYDREQLIKLSKKTPTLYKRGWITIIATLFVIFVDICCYLFMLSENQNSSDYRIILIAVGMAIAIDFIPIFIAHNLHRGERNRKKVLLAFNRICCGFILIFLGLVMAYRIQNVITVKSTNDVYNYQMDSIILQIIQSIIFSLIPIATSLFCFIINYLNYNPIEVKIRRKRRELLFKQEDVNELKALIKEIELRGDYKKSLLEKDKQMYDSANEMIESIGQYFKAYVRIEIAKALKSPADTTELSVL
ncbi:MAG: hypothetical protein HFG31_09065 [Eubacterium sp.]|nr:hypothetical protein [Eubacterium sp.]